MPQVGFIQLPALDLDHARHMTQLPVGWRDAVPVALVQHHILRRCDPSGFAIPSVPDLRANIKRTKASGFNLQKSTFSAEGM